MGSQGDAHTKVMRAHNLHQAGVLGVTEAHTTQLAGYLQTKGPQLLEALQCGLLHLLQRVILGRIVHFLKETGHRPHQFFEKLGLLLTEYRWVREHLIGGELTLEHPRSKGLGFRLGLLLSGRSLRGVGI